MLSIALLVSSLNAAPVWRPMGPYGGAAAFVTADPHRPGTFLSAGNNGLLFRSEDRGATWLPVRFPAQLRGILHVLAVDPARAATYYAGMGGGEVSGLWRTSDGGATWQPAEVLRGNEVWSLAFHPKKPGLMAAGTKTGVFLSRDGGETWQRISPAENLELQPVVSLAFDPSNERTMYAGTPHLPWNTTNGGASWQSIHTGMLDDSDVFSIQVDHSDPNRVYATACSGLYASSNGGGQWQKLRGAVGASYRTYFITQHPRNAKVLFAGTTRGLIRSDDGGGNWRQLSTHLTRALAFDPANADSFLVSTDDAGLERTADGGAHLENANRGFCNRHLTVLAPGGDSLYTSTMYDASGGLFRLDSSNAWNRVSPASALPGQQLLAIAPAEDNRRLYAAALNSLVVSADAGRRWVAVSSPPARSLITSLLTAPAPAPRLFIGTEQGLFRHEANGLWKKLVLAGADRVRALFNLDGLGIAAVTPSQAFLSRDGSVFASMGPLPAGVELLAMAHAGNGVLIAGTSHGILRSEDNGQTWRADPSGVTGTVNALCTDPGRPGIVYAAHYGEIFEIRAAERATRRISPEASPLQSIKSLAMLAGRPGVLFALTSRQGIFSLALE